MGQAQDLLDAHDTWEYFFKQLLNCDDEEDWNDIMDIIRSDMTIELGKDF
jgi:hypothetical protein